MALPRLLQKTEEGEEIMDSEYLKAKACMCNMHKPYCDECPLGKEAHRRNYPCNAFEIDNPEECVKIVEKWAAEHPKKTRQSEFLKMFPNASIVDGVPELNPCHVDNKFSPQKGCGNSSCGECRKEYWSQEVDDDE